MRCWNFRNPDKGPREIQSPTDESPARQKLEFDGVLLLLLKMLLLNKNTMDVGQILQSMSKKV